MTTSNSRKRRGAAAPMDWLARAREVFDIEIEGLQQVRAALDPAFEKVVAMIFRRLKAGGTIVVTGVGKNLHIADKLAATLASTGSRSLLLNPTQAMHGDLGMLSAGDVLLALSYSGESEEILKLLPAVRRLNVAIVAITGDPASALARKADLRLIAAVPREACPFNLAPTASTTATLALGDALAMVLLQARGFKREDYARLHPDGAIGRTLTLRVSDIMRKGARVARVRDTAKVKDAIFAMTKARAGSAAIVDEKGRLLGIFTDGDLRRAVAHHRNIVPMSVTKLMTANPIAVRADQLVVEALRLFESHNIDDLPVVDAEHRLVGAVDTQDLPKLKIL